MAPSSADKSHISLVMRNFLANWKNAVGFLLALTAMICREPSPGTRFSIVLEVLVVGLLVVAEVAVTASVFPSWRIPDNFVTFFVSSSSLPPCCSCCSSMGFFVVVWESSLLLFVAVSIAPSSLLLLVRLDNRLFVAPVSVDILWRCKFALPALLINHSLLLVVLLAVATTQVLLYFPKTPVIRFVFYPFLLHTHWPLSLPPDRLSLIID
mmetsp:Transcript_27796/g.61236  ORF Transcript_27796/g.61236 Transcript_27796/m.61236 type:complete len:210 (-) Transcript_27796:403-1032(-)